MTMHTFRKMAIIILLAIPLALSIFQATSIAADASMSVELNSAYVYHGITYNNGPVLQPSLDMTKGFFGFNVWGNYDIDDFHGTLKSRQFSEIDLTPYIFTTFKGTDLSLSLAEYNYPNFSTTNGTPLPSNREIILAVKRNIIGPISAEIKVQYEIKEVKDYYSRLSLFYTLPQCSSNLNVDLIASAAYVGDDTAKLSSGGQRGGFQEYNVKGVATYNLNKITKIGATVGYTDTMDRKVLPEQEVNFYGGISLALSL